MVPQVILEHTEAMAAVARCRADLSGVTLPPWTEAARRRRLARYEAEELRLREVRRAMYPHWWPQPKGAL